MKIINVHYGPYTTPPSIEEVLKYDVLELHEGGLWLTDWLGKIYTCSCKEVMKNTNISRSFFYLSGPHPAYQRSDETPFFKQENMTDDFLKLYIKMEKAAKSGNGKLKVRAETLFFGEIYGENTSYFVSPEDLLAWALDEGIYLPEDIQKATGFYLQKQGKKIKRIDSFLKKVGIKITGQMLRYYFPGKRTRFYCRHPWMKEYRPIHGAKDEYGTITKALDELRDPSIARTQGNRLMEDVEEELCHPQAIPEIVCQDPTGIWRYRIDALEVAMVKAANILLSEYRENFFKGTVVETQQQFIDNFINHEVTSLYLKNASSMLLERIRNHIKTETFDFFHYQEMCLLEMT